MNFIVAWADILVEMEIITGKILAGYQLSASPYEILMLYVLISQVESARYISEE